jgi:hypothetical protein
MFAMLPSVLKKVSYFTGVGCDPFNQATLLAASFAAEWSLSGIHFPVGS